MLTRFMVGVLTFLSSAANGADTCPITTAPKPAFVLPASYPNVKPAEGFYVGTAKLWVLVFPGPWRGLPLWPEGYRNHISWYSEGYSAKDAGPVPELSITGRRLDGVAPPMTTDVNSVPVTPSYVLAGINLPTTGCWEITGRFRGSEVKFVVNVQP